MFKPKYEGDPICYIFDSNCDGIEVGSTFQVELHCITIHVKLLEVIEKGHWDNVTWICSKLRYELSQE